MNCVEAWRPVSHFGDVPTDSARRFAMPGSHKIMYAIGYPFKRSILLKLGVFGTRWFGPLPVETFCVLFVPWSSVVGGSGSGMADADHWTFPPGDISSPSLWSPFAMPLDSSSYEASTVVVTHIRCVSDCSAFSRSILDCAFVVYPFVVEEERPYLTKLKSRRSLMYM